MSDAVSMSLAAALARSATKGWTLSCWIVNLAEARRQSGVLAGSVQDAASKYAQTDRSLAERINRATFPQSTDNGREPAIRPAGWGTRPPPPLEPPLTEKTTQQLLDEYKALKKEIDAHNDRLRYLPRDQASVAAYNAEKAELDARRAALEAELRARGVQIGAPIPEKVQDVLNQIDAGRWPGAANAPGTKGGGPWRNVTPDGENPLPTMDAGGNPIIYQEWDVNPKAPGAARDTERIVTGSDGSAWYTPDHYGTFQRIR